MHLLLILYITPSCILLILYNPLYEFCSSYITPFMHPTHPIYHLHVSYSVNSSYNTILHVSYSSYTILHASYSSDIPSYSLLQNIAFSFYLKKLERAPSLLHKLHTQFLYTFWGTVLLFRVGHRVIGENDSLLYFKT